MKDPKIIDSFLELYAWCTMDEETTERPGTTDRVHKNHLYRVARFVEEDGYFPHGVKLKDYRGNELTETFFMQQFVYFHIYLN